MEGPKPLKSCMESANCRQHRRQEQHECSLQEEGILSISNAGDCALLLSALYAGTTITVTQSNDLVAATQPVAPGKSE
jgi:hypothetical protein